MKTVALQCHVDWLLFTVNCCCRCTCALYWTFFWKQLAVLPSVKFSRTGAHKSADPMALANSDQRWNTEISKWRGTPDQASVHIHLIIYDSIQWPLVKFLGVHFKLREDSRQNWGWNFNLPMDGVSVHWKCFPSKPSPFAEMHTDWQCFTHPSIVLPSIRWIESPPSIRQRLEFRCSFHSARASHLFSPES